MKRVTKKLVFDVFRIVAAAIVATLLATVLNLEFAVAAGIVAILTIQPTKRETFATAMGRLLAFVCALVIAYASFSVLGYNLTGFFVYLFVFIVICQLFSWYSAMAMNSVLISHFLNFGEMTIATVTNELLIFAIGVGMGIVANMFLTKKTAYMCQLMEQTDEQIAKILFRMGERVLDKDMSDYNGECFRVLEDLLYRSEQMAQENYKNQLDDKDVFDMQYIAMRRRQAQVLFEMYKNVRRLSDVPITGGRIAEFFKNMAGVFHRDNDVRELLQELRNMEQYMAIQPMPATRDEFEDRARLFVIMESMDEFLQIKADFVKEKIGK